ncbi:MAG: hypothetical protein ACE5KF_11230 [Kiloniellaceae bacterium]
MRVFVIVLLCGLGAAQAARATPGEIHFIQADSIALRQSPDQAAPVLLRLDRGHKLLEFARRGDWVKVAVFGMVGREAWVHRSGIGPEAPGDDGAPPLRTGPVRPAAGPDRPEAEGGSAAGPLFLLRISGSPALKFAGRCRVIGRAGRDRRIDLDGFVPESLRLEAAAVSCRVRKRDFQGRLTVELRADGRHIARAETRAPLNHVIVRSAGPWGRAAGLKGGIGIPAATIGPGAPAGPVPPLTGVKVPPLTGVKVPPLTRP